MSDTRYQGVIYQSRCANNTCQQCGHNSLWDLRAYGCDNCKHDGTSDPALHWDDDLQEWVRPARRLRAGVSRTRANEHGRHALAFGASIGYWPCLHAPYLQISFGSRRLDMWHGPPSYRTEGDAE